MILIIGLRPGLPSAVEFEFGPDYRGRFFDRFHAHTDPAGGPGWYVFGRNPEYGDRMVKLVARPNVKPRKHPHYNGPVRRGWHLKRDAVAVAKYLNERFPGGTDVKSD